MADASASRMQVSLRGDARRRVISWIHVLLSVAVILFVSATAYGYYKLNQESELAQYKSQAALWLVVSFEREYLKFDSLMTRYNTSSGTEYGFGGQRESSRRTGISQIDRHDHGHTQRNAQHGESELPRMTHRVTQAAEK